MPSAKPQHLADYLRRLTLTWLVPLAALALVLVSLLLLLVHQRQTSELERWAHHLAQEIDVDLERRQHGLKAIAAMTASEDSPMDLKRWYAHARAYDLVFGTPVILADEQRRILFNTRVPLGEPLDELPKPPGRSAFFDALMSGEPKTSDVVMAPILGREIVSVVVPLDKRHALLGLVVLPKLEPLMRKIPLNWGWEATVYDSVGQIIASTSTEPLPLNESRSPRRTSAGTQDAPWTVVVQAGVWPFYRPHVIFACGLTLCIGLAFGGTAWATRRGSLGLEAAVQELIEKRSNPPRASGHSAKPRALGTPQIVELEQARRELQRLSRQHYQAEEAERARIARELHDGLQQDAAAAVVHLEILKAQVQASSTPLKAVMSALECVRRVIRGLTQAVEDLRPAAGAPGGLVAALQAATKQFSDITGIHADCEIVGDEAGIQGLPEPVVNGLYRVAQECLNNVRKHAQASFVHLELDITQPAQVRMTVMDDGVGLSPSGNGQPVGYGMQSMVERINALNGTLAVWRGHEQNAQRGTTIMATVPLSPEERAAAKATPGER